MIEENNQDNTAIYIGLAVAAYIIWQIFIRPIYF